MVWDENSAPCDLLLSFQPCVPSLWLFYRLLVPPWRPRMQTLAVLWADPVALSFSCLLRQGKRCWSNTMSTDSVVCHPPSAMEPIQSLFLVFYLQFYFHLEFHSNFYFFAEIFYLFIFFQENSQLLMEPSRIVSKLSLHVSDIQAIFMLSVSCHFPLILWVFLVLVWLWWTFWGILNLLECLLLFYFLQ
jgi:hypothetical protein